MRITSPEQSQTSVICARSTRQRSAVAAVLQEVDDHRFAKDRHEILRNRGGRVGLATAYRSLRTMADAGDIDVPVTAEGGRRYRRCGQAVGHHHHLVCRSCGPTIEVEAPSVERWAAATAAEHGFPSVQHTLDIFETCQRCAPTSGRQGKAVQDLGN